MVSSVSNTDGVNLSMYTPNENYNVTEATVVRDETFYECCPGVPYVSMIFHVYVELTFL